MIKATGVLLSLALATAVHAAPADGARTGRGGGGMMATIRAKIAADGVISKDDFLATARKAYDARAAKTAPKRSWEEVSAKMSARFAKLDADGDGKVTTSEIAARRRTHDGK